MPRSVLQQVVDSLRGPSPTILLTVWANDNPCLEGILRVESGGPFGIGDQLKITRAGKRRNEKPVLQVRTADGNRAGTVTVYEGAFGATQVLEVKSIEEIP